jgi:hypothetical protein
MSVLRFPPPKRPPAPLVPQRAWMTPSWSRGARLVCLAGLIVQPCAPLARLRRSRSPE